MNMKKGVFGDFIMGILLIVFGAGTSIISLRMKVFKNFLDAPGLFPLILGVLFILLGLMLFLPSLKGGGPAAVKQVLEKTALKQFMTDDKTIRTLILVALMVVYIFVLVGRVPFLLSTWLYLVSTMAYLKSTKLWRILVISTIASVLICVVFKYGFRIPLP